MPFDLSTKLKIGHRVLIQKESQSDLAKEFRVSPKFISQLIASLKKKREMMHEMVSASEKRELLLLEFREFT